VIVLSTCASATESDVKPTARNRNEPQKKPDVILDYNRYMGGIDGNDMMTYFYLDERRTVKYWKKVAFNMIARMVLNAYLLYLENNNGKKMTRLQFYSCIIETISNEWIEKRNDIYHGICFVNNMGQNNPACGVKLLLGKLERKCLVCHNPRQ